MVAVYLTSQATKDIRKLPTAEQKKIKKRLQLLTSEIYAGKKLAGKLSNLYSLRAWPYRIIYLIQAGEVWVVHIAHRQGVYK